MPKITGLGLVLVATLAVALAQCSGSGGSAVTEKPTPAPTPTLAPSPAPFVFTGSTITNNVMTLPCATNETFTIAQGNYSGTFNLVTSNVNLVVTPTSGTSSQTFTLFDNQGNAPGTTQTVTASTGGSNPATGTLTVNITIGDCG